MREERHGVSRRVRRFAGVALRRYGGVTAAVTVAAKNSVRAAATLSGVVRVSG